MAVRTDNSSGASGVGAEPGVLGLLAIGAGIVYLFGLFASLAIGVAVVLHVAGGGVLLALALRGRERNGVARLGLWVSVLSFAGALACAPMIAAFHWIPYFHSALAVSLAWGCGAFLVLVSGAARLLHAFLALLLAAALAAVVMFLPAPAGAEDPDDPENQTTIIVRCEDERGNPIGEVPVFFELKLIWLPETPQEELDQWTSREITGSVKHTSESSVPGEAEWSFQDDPKARVVVIQTPGTQTDNFRTLDAGFEPAREVLISPARGRTHRVTFRLKERPDPAHAYLELAADESVAVSPADRVRLGLFDDGSMDGRTVAQGESAPQSVTYGSDTERGPYRLVFRLPAADAGRSLYLYDITREDSASWRPSFRYRLLLEVPRLQPGQRHVLPYPLAKD